MTSRYLLVKQWWLTITSRCNNKMGATAQLLLCKWWRASRWMKMTRQQRDLPSRSFSLIWLNPWTSSSYRPLSSAEEDLQTIYAKMSRMLSNGMYLTTLSLEKAKRRRLTKSLKFKWKGVLISGKLCIGTSSESLDNLPARRFRMR